MLMWLFELLQTANEISNRDTKDLDANDLRSRATHILGQLKETYQICTELELPENKQLEILLPHSESVQIVEFDVESNFPSLATLERIEELERSLLIDPTLKKPQEGYGRTFPVDELLHLLSKPGAKIFALTIDSDIAGFYIIHTDQESLPAEIQATFELLDQRGLLKRSAAGWGEIVGISKEAREMFEGTGFDAHRALVTAVIESAFALGLDQLFGEVREGTYANTAKAKHVAKGWEETGIFIERGDTPFQLLQFPLKEHGGTALE